MHVLAIALTAGVLHAAVVRLRVPLAVLVLGCLVVLMAVNALVRPTGSWDGVVGGAVVLVALVSGAVRRQFRLLVDDVAAARPDASAVRSDGQDLVRRLEIEGFEVANDGWTHAERLGWSFIALRRGPSRVFMVSGERGPAIDLATTFDNGRTLLTAATGRDRVSGDVVRQVIRTDDPLELLVQHHDAVAAASAEGRTPIVPAVGRLTAEALADEVAHARYLLAGGVPTAVASMWRELSRTHADVGPVIERPADWARLLADHQR